MEEKIRRQKRNAVYFLTGLIAFVFFQIFKSLLFLKLNQITLFIYAPVIKVLDYDFFVLRHDYDVVEKRTVNKAILAIPSFGCEHFFKHGGCAMCGFNNEIVKFKLRYLHPTALVFLISLLILFFDREKKRMAKKIDSLSIFMAGSFFNINELPLKAQDIIISFFKESDIKKIVVESRPEYIIAEKERIAGYKIIESGKSMEIAIGLEAADDYIRNVHVRKNISRVKYQTAVKAIKSFGALSSTYVLIGIPYLSREEIIDSAVKTAIFAWHTGSDLVNLEAYSVQEKTIWAELYAKGNIAPPTLWTIAEVAKKIDQISHNWYLGEFSDWPEPIAKPKSCSICQEKLLDAFKKLRAGQGVCVLEGLVCLICE